MSSRVANQIEQEQAYRPRFIAALDACATLVAAQELATLKTPPPDAPGRPFHSNLGWFLQAFTVPGGAGGAELGAYLRFVRRIAADGQIKPDALPAIVSALELAIAERGHGA